MLCICSCAWRWEGREVGSLKCLDLGGWNITFSASVLNHYFPCKLTWNPRRDPPIWGFLLLGVCLDLGSLKKSVCLDCILGVRRRKFLHSRSRNSCPMRIAFLAFTRSGLRRHAGRQSGDIESTKRHGNTQRGCPSLFCFPFLGAHFVLALFMPGVSNPGV